MVAKWISFFENLEKGDNFIDNIIKKYTKNIITMRIKKKFKNHFLIYSENK